jgi:hypothetical protein
VRHLALPFVVVHFGQYFGNYSPADVFACGFSGCAFSVKLNGFDIWKKKCGAEVCFKIGKKFE